MIQENIEPDDMLRISDQQLTANIDKKEEEDHDEEENEEDVDYDILPSNGPGLAGDDGEQTVDSDAEEETEGSE